MSPLKQRWAQDTVHYHGIRLLNPTRNLDEKIFYTAWADNIWLYTFGTPSLSQMIVDVQVSLNEVGLHLNLDESSWISAS